MRTRVTTLLLLGALSIAPAVVLAAGQATAASTMPAKHAAKSTTATHASRGVVKSIDDSSLVITRPGKKASEMTFTLNASTHREGNVAVGAPISVRYREDGSTNVATAITGKAVAHSKASVKK